MSKTDKKEMIGKGLRSLLGGIETEMKQPVSQDLSPMANQRVPLKKIGTNPRQPRSHFDEKALQELADSIKRFDIIQPLTVSHLPDGNYRLIAGERRFRAAKMAGLEDVPVYIRKANDEQLLELAVLENLQREDLNAIEVAISYQRMVDELHYTIEQVAERMGKDRTTVTNYVRLLKLPPAIQAAVKNGDISMSHARTIINLELVDKQLYIFKEITDKGLNVRQTELLARQMQQPGKKKPSSNEKKLQPAYKKIEDELASHFSTKVHLNHAKNGGGSIKIEYYSVQELNKLLNQLGVQIH